MVNVYGSEFWTALWRCMGCVCLKVGSTELPINLTQGNNKRDEDPKFIDNQRIIFKQNGDLKIIKMTDRTMTSVTQNGWDIEESMPYPMVNTTQILYAKVLEIILEFLVLISRVLMIHS